MKARKLLALILSVIMVLSLAACGANEAPADAPTTEATQPETTPETVPETVPEVVETPKSVDFEDGNFGFVALYEGMANADAATFEVVDYNGGKALKVTNGSGKVPYIAIDVWSLLGEAAATVTNINMTMGIENPDGEFYACSGKVMLWNEKELSKTTDGWSVYLENKNPKNAAIVLEAEDGQVFSADVAPIMVVTLDTDNGATAGVANANFFIDDITFLDGNGNVIPADTSVTFAEPKGFSGDKDMSNLQILKPNAVALEGMSGKTAGAWSQDGVEMTADFLAALVPGAVIEIEYSSTSGDMWIVMPDSAAGWMRVAQQVAATNNSKNICQITYEEIAALCGEDITTWGARLQCESSGDWTVYSVKVGTPSGLVNSAKKTAWYEGSITGGAWSQNGIDLTEEMIAALVPGAMIEVKYTTTSATGDLWIVMPDAAAGWSRVAQQTAACDGATMQITFEQIAAVCGEDVSQWGTRMQLESDGDWEVFSISLVNSAFVNTKGNVAIDGAACTGGAWGQNGPTLTEEQIALLVPGAVLTINYTTTSATGDLWIVMPDSSVGWTRVEQMTAACDGSVCQITFEQIAALCGDNVADWGTRIQFESDGDWEVFSLAIGSAA